MPFSTDPHQAKQPKNTNVRAIDKEKPEQNGESSLRLATHFPSYGGHSSGGKRSPAVLDGDLAVSPKIQHWIPPLCSSTARASTTAMHLTCAAHKHQGLD